MFHKRGLGFPNSLPDCLGAACFSSSCIRCNCKFRTCETEEWSGPVDVANYGSLAGLQFAPHVARRRPWSIWGSHGEPASVLPPTLCWLKQNSGNWLLLSKYFIYQIIVFRGTSCLVWVAIIHDIRFRRTCSKLLHCHHVSSCFWKNGRRTFRATVKFNFDPHWPNANFQAGWLKLEERENMFCSRAENKYMEIFSGASFPLRLALQK